MSYNFKDFDAQFPDDAVMRGAIKNAETQLLIDCDDVAAIELVRVTIAGALDHAHCPVCSANVHGRVTVALNYLNAGKVTKAKTELEMLLPLVKP